MNLQGGTEFLSVEQTRYRGKIRAHHARERFAAKLGERPEQADDEGLAADGHQRFRDAHAFRREARPFAPREYQPVH